MPFDIRSIAVVAVALGGCAWDLRTRRLPNALTGGAAAAALLFAVSVDGISGLGWSAAGGATAVALFFPFFALGGMGAGDVKLLGALGAWLGALDALYLALVTSLAGGVIAVGVMLWHRRGRQTLSNLWLLLTFWRTAGLRPVPELTLQNARGPKLAYAVPIAVGAIATLWLR